MGAFSLLCLSKVRGIHRSSVGGVFPRNCLLCVLFICHPQCVQFACFSGRPVCPQTPPGNRLKPWEACLLLSAPKLAQGDAGVELVGQGASFLQETPIPTPVECPVVAIHSLRQLGKAPGYFTSKWGSGKKGRCEGGRELFWQAGREGGGEGGENPERGLEPRAEIIHGPGSGLPGA